MRPDFEPFGLVQWQTRHESTVDYSLADSSCTPVALDEFIDGDTLARLAREGQHYAPVGGTSALRGLIAAWHGADPGQVMVTVGAAEANTVLVQTLVQAGDHVVVMEPGYRQIWGAAKNAGAKVEPFPLDPRQGWAVDLEALDRVVHAGTRVISITNPNNPSGSILSDVEMAAIVEVAGRVGAWLLVDEVHRGTELDTAALTPTFWGRYERVICVGSMSKAFGLPGLRVGWLVAPNPIYVELWRRHEYETVTTSLMSMRAAELALSPAHQDALLERNRGLMRRGRALLTSWVAGHADELSMVPPRATALGLVQYRKKRESLAMAEAIRQAGVLVGAGVHFGAEGHLRITHALDAGYVTAALERIGKALN